MTHTNFRPPLKDFRPPLSRALDWLARPEVVVLGRACSSFHLCGGAGMVCVVALGASLAARTGLRPWVTALVVVTSVLTFISLALATKIVAGGERLVYYHQEVAVVAVAAATVWLLGEPVLPYLDATALCLGAFLCCGRVGCLMVGCCHGRPHGWGVCYRAEHAAAGFTRYYVGVRLFPVQAVEALWVLFAVVVGVVLVAGGRAPGAALAWYVVAYDAGRFCFEFIRGDADRPYRWGFSEAQWTSLGLTALVAAAELSGLLPLLWWHVGAVACTALAMVVVAAARRAARTPRHRLLHPRHVRELAEAVETLSHLAEEAQRGRATIRVGRTSLGVLISAGGDGDTPGGVRHYSLSYQHGVMDEGAARALAELICRLRRCPGSGALVRGQPAVFHLVIHPSLST